MSTLFAIHDRTLVPQERQGTADAAPAQGRRRPVRLALSERPHQPHLELRHRAAMYADPARWGEGLALNVLGCVFAVALWNMKRWAAPGCLLPDGRRVSPSHFNIATHPLTVAALRLVPLLPAAYHWRRLT